MDRIKSGKYRKWNISRMTLMVGVGAAVVLARAALGSDRWCRYGVDSVIRLEIVRNYFNNND